MELSKCRIDSPVNKQSSVSWEQGLSFGACSDAKENADE